METAQMTYRFTGISLKRATYETSLISVAYPNQNSITYSTYYFLDSPLVFPLHYFDPCFLFTERFAKTPFLYIFPSPLPPGLLLTSFNILFLIQLSKKIYIEGGHVKSYFALRKYKLFYFFIHFIMRRMCVVFREYKEF